MDDARVATKTEPNRLVQWSDDDRALAFELYYTDAGRSLTTLQEIISTYPYERPIPYRTLYHWRQVDRWDIEADKRADAFAPNRRRRTVQHLTVAAERFSAYLSQVASGAVEPNKLKIVAAKIALDAAGFASARVQPDLTPIISDHTDTTNDPTDGMTSQEKIAYYRARSQRKPT